jgi:hypothetical protein
MDVRITHGLDLPLGTMGFEVPTLAACVGTALRLVILLRFYTGQVDLDTHGFPPPTSYWFPTV